MRFRTFVRAAVTAGAAAALVAGATPAAHADTTLACSQYIQFEDIQIPAYVNCQLDNVGNLIVRIGNCVFYYDPLFPPFPSNVVPETVQLATCI
jgi:hypothetical protein